jgi:hypothetical protein
MSKKNGELVKRAVDPAVLEKLKTAESAKSRHSSYEAMIAYHSGRMTLFYREAMQARWEMGLDLKAIKEKKIYGDKTMEKFVEDLDDPGFDVKLAYACAQFAEEFTAEDLAEVLTYEHVYWGVVVRLLPLKDKELRRKLMARLDSGELKPSKLDDELRLLKAAPPGKEGADEGAGSSPKAGASAGDGSERQNFTANFIKLKTLCLTVDKAAEACRKDLQDLDEQAGDNDRYEKIVDVMTETRDEVKILTETLADLLTDLKKVTV